MRSDGECAWREQDGVNRVCVRIAWTRNKLISTICSQFRNGLPKRGLCSYSCQFFPIHSNFFFSCRCHRLPMMLLVSLACARYHDTFESINFELLLPSAIPGEKAKKVHLPKSILSTVIYGPLLVSNCHPTNDLSAQNHISLLEIRTKMSNPSFRTLSIEK